MHSLCAAPLPPITVLSCGAAQKWPLSLSVRLNCKVDKQQGTQSMSSKALLNDFICKDRFSTNAAIKPGIDTLQLLSLMQRCIGIVPLCKLGCTNFDSWRINLVQSINGRRSFISSTFSHGKRFEKGAHKLLCLWPVFFPAFSSFLPLSCSSLPSGCVKRREAAWVSSQTLEPNPVKSDTHTHTHGFTCTFSRICSVCKESYLCGRRNMGRAKAGGKKRPLKR